MILARTSSKYLIRARSLPQTMLISDSNSQPPTPETRYLRSKDVEAPLPDLTYLLPEATPKSGIYVIDTGEMFAALEGSSNKNNQSLQTVCRRLGIPTEYLHNAGNDAHVSLSFTSLLTPQRSRGRGVMLLAL